MKKLLATTALAALISSSAFAEVKTFYQSGTWKVFGGNTGKSEVCGMGIGSDDRGLAIKVFSGDDFVTIHLVKFGWKIPSDTQIPVEVQIDRAEPWNAVGVGRDNAIELQVHGYPQIKTFWDEIKSGMKMVVVFPSGNEIPWIADLSGSADATKTLVSCISSFTISDTQPFGLAPPVPIPSRPAFTGKRT